MMGRGKGDGGEGVSLNRKCIAFPFELYLYFT